MADPIPIQLGTRSNKGRYGYDGHARLINCYAEGLGNEGKVPWPLYASDGFSSFATLSGGGVRAVIAVNNELYAVAGRVLNRVDSGGGVTQLGGVASDGLVTMAQNRRSVPQIAVTCDGLSQIISGGVLSIISDADLPAANSVSHLDGYFVWLMSDGRMFSSAIDDGTTIDGLDFATAESSPDRGIRIFTAGRDLVVFGSKSTEFWQNTGGSDFPFTRVTTRDYGCLAPGSVASVLLKRGGNVMDATGFVGTNNDGAYAGVFLLQGYAVAKISTPQCDRDVLAEEHPENIRGMSWDDGTHSFYAISGDNFTWVFDATTGLPHERRSYGLNRWRVATATAFAGRTIFGDYAAATLYQAGSSSYSEAGTPIVMEIQTPPVHAYPHKMRFNGLYLDVLPGVGDNSTGDELDPVIGVSYSEDGGATWSAERMHAVGRQGQRRTRVKSTRLGVSGEDGRSFRLRMSANVAKGIMGASIDVDKLRA
ncbi:MAG: hypothetical protein ACOYLK_14705 [Sphingomonas sp.]